MVRLNLFRCQNLLIYYQFHNLAICELFRINYLNQVAELLDSFGERLLACSRPLACFVPRAIVPERKEGQLVVDKKLSRQSLSKASYKPLLPCSRCFSCRHRSLCPKVRTILEGRIGNLVHLVALAVLVPKTDQGKNISLSHVCSRGIHVYT